jgi:hypothetical protein
MSVSLPLLTTSSLLLETDVCETSVAYKPLRSSIHDTFVSVRACSFCRYTALFWVRDQAGYFSRSPARVAWTVLYVAPDVAVLHRPSPISSLRSPWFTFAINGSDTSAAGSVWIEVSLAGDATRGAYHRPCDEQDALVTCNVTCTPTLCNYSTCPRTSVYY